MPYVMDERFDTQRASMDVVGANDSVERIFFLYEDAGDDTDEAAAHAFVIGNIPFLHFVPQAAGVRTLYLQSHSVEHAGAANWVVTGHYGPRDPWAVTWSGDTTGGRQHITRSLRTVATVKDDAHFAANQPINFQGNIGVDGESVQGCDIVVPTCNLTATVQIPRGQFTLVYEHKLEDLTGTMNKYAFRGRKTAEVLFLGAVWTDAPGIPNIETVFKFWVQKEKVFTAQTFSLDLDGLTKRGHDYLWLFSVKKSNANHLVRQPVMALVEQVYEEADFAQLGLGDGT